MTWTVGDRDKAINACNFEKQGNKNQCLGCANSRESSSRMMLDCTVWCVDVAHNEVCYKYISKIEKNKG